MITAVRRMRFYKSKIKLRLEKGQGRKSHVEGSWWKMRNLFRTESVPFALAGKWRSVRNFLCSFVSCFSFPLFCSYLTTPLPQPACSFTERVGSDPREGLNYWYSQMLKQNTASCGCKSGVWASGDTVVGHKNRAYSQLLETCVLLCSVSTHIPLGTVPKELHRESPARQHGSHRH